MAVVQLPVLSAPQTAKLNVLQKLSINFLSKQILYSTPLHLMVS